MGKLFDLVQQLFEILSLVWDFVWGLIQDLIYIATLLPKIIIGIPGMLEAFIPSSVVSIFVILISITVIYRVMGRD